MFDFSRDVVCIAVHIGYLQKQKNYTKCSYLNAGDDTLIAIQTRGGPDRLTVTSWVQIMEFKPTHTGNYTCSGTNAAGTATATGTLEIRKMV